MELFQTIGHDVAPYTTARSKDRLFPACLRRLDISFLLPSSVALIDEDDARHLIEDSRKVLRNCASCFDQLSFVPFVIHVPDGGAHKWPVLAIYHLEFIHSQKTYKICTYTANTKHLYNVGPTSKT